MNGRSLVSPEDQRVTFVELFFDLVFVFSVTQIVSLLHDGLTWLAIGQSILVFWLVWWAWTQFTWALNAADTTNPVIEMGALIATAVAFFMAVAVPDAFEGRAIWFAIPYVLVRVIGIVLYGEVAAAADPSQHAAVRRFAIVSIGGLVAVIVGALAGGTAQYYLWGVTILLDVVAAMIGAESEDWNLHPDHFSERHGLFVIIALGETLIVAAGGVIGVTWTPDLAAVTLLAVAVTCGLWWTYFSRTKPALDHALESCTGAQQSAMARDAFSLTHFPMLCGVIAYAVATEEAIARPSEPLDLPVRLALAASLLLFVGGMALALMRARRGVLSLRLIITLVTAGAIVLISGVSPPWTLAIALAGILAVAVQEERGNPFTLQPHSG